MRMDDIKEVIYILDDLFKNKILEDVFKVFKEEYVIFELN